MEVSVEPHAKDSLPPRTSFDEIRAEVERVINSADFNVPQRAKQFLTYIVDETLAGRAARIKAYSIAVAVFGRHSSFDAQSDPVVRIEAGRIRRALERYYLVAGADDPIVITIPKGSYVPIFTPRDPEAEPTVEGTPKKRPPWIWQAVIAVAGFAVAMMVANGALHLAEEDNHTASTAADRTSLVSSAADALPAAPDLPRVLIEPFADLSSTHQSAIVARGLTDEVVGQIAKFKEIVPVVNGPPGQSGQADQAVSRNERVRYALEGSVRIEGEKLRLTTRLVNTADGSVIWANNYDENLDVQDLLKLQVDVARKVATAVAQPYGIIFHADATQMSETPPNDWEAYECTLAYYAYRADLRPETHSSVMECLKRATERFPSYATAWALLSLIYLDEVRFRYAVHAGPTPRIDRALVAARRAVGIDPENTRALQAYMTALFFHGDVDAALKVGKRAVEINPNDTELLGEYGMRLALSGQWGQGRELMMQVRDRHPGPYGYFEVVVALSYYMQGDYASAATWIRKANRQDNPYYHLVAAAIFGQLGSATEAQDERDWLLNNASDFLAELPETIRLRNISAPDRAHLLEGLRKSGLPAAGL